MLVSKKPPFALSEDLMVASHQHQQVVHSTTSKCFTWEKVEHLLLVHFKLRFCWGRRMLLGPEILSFQSPSRLCLCMGLPILLGPSAGSCLSALSDGRAFDPVGVWLPGSCYASSPRRGKLNLTFSGKMVSPTPAPVNAPLTGKQHVKCRRVQSERVASVTGCHCLGACDSVLEERCVYTRKCTYGG